MPASAARATVARRSSRGVRGEPLTGAPPPPRLCPLPAAVVCQTHKKAVRTGRPQLASATSSSSASVSLTSASLSGRADPFVTDLQSQLGDQ